MGVFESNILRLPKPNYKYITKIDEARTVLNEISKYNILEVDSETTGLDPYTSKISLLQIGIPNQAFVFDMRCDTEHSDVSLDLFRPVLTDKNVLKILQNAVFDMKVIKLQGGYYVENIYDTMLVEQLFYLGLHGHKADLATLIFKYLGITVDKEPRNTFSDYNQVFKPFQLEYAANDVLVLDTIRNMQIPRIVKEGFENVCRLEFEFTKPMCEMELNGICFDVDKQRIILAGVEKEKDKHGSIVRKMLSEAEDQTTLFDVSLINIDSNVQLKKALNKSGFELESTDVNVLKKFSGMPIIDELLAYRKAQKFISTYGENLIDKINPVTGRLHTRFRQMVKTGRMSSSAPNLQNIPKKQIYRSCFTAKPGCVLITCDMGSAELRIIGNFSKDPIFIQCFREGIDLHSRTASEMFGMPIGEVKHKQRGAAKSLNFGLAYGLSKFGLAIQLKVSEKEAQDMINSYFDRYRGIKKFLDKAGKDAVKKRYSPTISGRKRFFSLPEYSHSDFSKIKRRVEREGKNTQVQGCLVFDSKIKGLGDIGDQLHNTVKIETGFGKDTAKVVFSGKKDVYSLKLSNGVDLGITLDHKIPVVSKNSDVELFRDVSVENLTENDLIMISLDVVDGRKTNLSGYKYEKGHWRETFVEYPYPNEMTPDLAFVIGCLIGDGNYSKYNHFSFVCPSSQKELFDKFNNCVDEVFGYKPIIRYTHKNDPNRLPLPVSQVSSVVIRGFLKHIGLDYVKHRNKKIPDFFYSETIKNRAALLNGLFSTDGGVTAESGPNFTSVSKNLAGGVQQLLFSFGINSNLKEYNNEYGEVYRLQIPKRFNGKFRDFIGFSVDAKHNMLLANCYPPKFGDYSIVPEFIPKTIEKIFRKSPTFFNDFDYKEKAHLRRFKLGECSYTSWRKFYNRLPECGEKKILSKYLNYDFCRIKELKYRGKENTYDLVCDNVHYFIANGVILHNSNADTIKEAMIIVVNKLEEHNMKSRLLLTVHDEIVIEAPFDEQDEAKKIAEQALIEGFGRYFDLIPMEADALCGPCWLKSECENEVVDGKECGGQEMDFVEDPKYGTKLICKKCGAEQ